MKLILAYYHFIIISLESREKLGILRQEVQEQVQKTGVLLLNMGGPTDIYGVESFLRNIFNDPLLLPIKNSIIRKLVGNLIVSKRLEIAKQNYKAIGGSSPMAAYTFSLTQKLNSLDSTRLYSYAMRYAAPFAKEALLEFQAKGINDIVLFSMYPQYSSTTIFSSLNDVYQNLKNIKDYKPRVRVIEQFYEYEPFYELIVDEIEKTLESANSKDFILILSAHSLPQSIVDKGDPYVDQCQKGKEIIQKICAKRGLEFSAIKLAYQSKVGPMKWIEPSTKQSIIESKDKNIIIYPLAFSIDNSETIYELGIQYAKLAKDLGISDYRVCACMNDSSAFAKMIIELIEAKYPQES